ncbi:glycoside hydrolase family 9 protein [Roseimarinus sediminis]|uniref:glycoside hydrolase family 9 protein n=1 Tax=Roseimarinus sediminis TaxID=1610899 RepID=UPI003D24EB92
MKEFFKMSILMLLVFFLGTLCVSARETDSKGLVLNEKEYYQVEGVNFLVFTNWYNGLFGDEKTSGVELIHHGVRTVTNGDVRMMPTPEQWDPVPRFIERKVDREKGVIEARLEYPEHNFAYTIRSEAKGEQLIVSVLIDQALPEQLVGKAGFNMEFLPAAYFEKTYLADDKPGAFPLYPSGPMKINDEGLTEALSLANGRRLVLAPEDDERRVTIEAEKGELMLFDGRNKAQNGWYVVRSLIPSGLSGEVIRWTITANSIEGWMRKPMIAYSQLGYHPAQKKVARVELDASDHLEKEAELYQIDASGTRILVKKAMLTDAGSYLRYRYGTFDFSEVTSSGLYCIKLEESITTPFRIADDIYLDAWQPALDIYLPVQMDHMMVNEAYRVWHGLSHMDDALQAPVNHTHFDLYAQGPTTDTPYQPGEHIPGLNVGGWFDAGDYDIRTQTHYHTISTMVDAWEHFKIDRDQTLVDQSTRYVDLHHPDGKADLLQQIEHGVLALVAQYHSCGHAIPGIIVGDISQYTHLGDAITMTDNLIYNPELGENESNGFESGKFDDRWAFTSRSTPLNYGSAAALAAASRVLAGYNDTLAAECLRLARSVWEEEGSKEPDLFHVGNTTGGELTHEKLKAAIELLLATGDDKYQPYIREVLSEQSDAYSRYASLFVKARPKMDEQFNEALRNKVVTWMENQPEFDNPFNVPITRGGWAGNGAVMGYAINNYLLHKAYPDLVSNEAVFDGLNYILGCHPASNLSFVSGIGTVSKKVAYGMNRADYSFIAGGVVPGVLILPPDFPENKEDWPFLWGENEYVIPMSMSYLFLVHAVNDLLK